MRGSGRRTTFWLSQPFPEFVRESGMPKAPPLRLGVNVDHVATLRNARAGERPAQTKRAAERRAAGIESHPGAWCDAVVGGQGAKAEGEGQGIGAGAALARSAGREAHAAPGLDYVPAEKIASIPEIVELNIG